MKLRTWCHCTLLAIACDRTPDDGEVAKAAATPSPDRATTPATTPTPATATPPSPATPPSTATPPSPASTPAPGPASTPSVAPSAPPATTPTTAPTPFETLAEQLGASRSPAPAPDLAATKTKAWEDYKAKRYPEAARGFAVLAMAQRMPWKDAFNLACALSLAGRTDDARIALAEAIDRGGDTVAGKAKKDGDLAALRKEPWFAALVEGTGEGGDEADAFERCMDHPTDACVSTMLEGDFRFGDAIAFTTPVTLSLTPPSTRPKQRMRAIGKTLPWKTLQTELGLTGMHGSGSPELVDPPGLMANEEFEGKPFWWWPDDDANPIAVIPHVHRSVKDGSPASVATFTLARQLPEGWRAVTLDVTTPNQYGGRRSTYLQSGVGVRFDGYEIFALSQMYTDGDDGPPVERRLCRIRHHDGALRMACATSWTDHAP